MKLQRILSYDGGDYTKRTNVEFDNLGETTRSEITIIWLAAGTDGGRLCLVETRVESAAGIDSSTTIFPEPGTMRFTLNQVWIIHSSKTI